LSPTLSNTGKQTLKTQHTQEYKNDRNQRQHRNKIEILKSGDF